MLLYMFVRTQTAYILSPFVNPAPGFTLLHDGKGNFDSYLWSMVKQLLERRAARRSGMAGLSRLTAAIRYSQLVGNATPSIPTRASTKGDLRVFEYARRRQIAPPSQDADVYRCMATTIAGADGRIASDSCVSQSVPDDPRELRCALLDLGWRQYADGLF
jgi:hypothetical protein